MQHHPTPKSILVAGASGHLGRLVVEELLFKKEGGEGVNIIAGCHDVSSLTDLKKRGAELLQLKHDSVDSLVEHFKGVECVVLVSSPLLNIRRQLHLNMIQAAEKAGVTYFIYTSFICPTENVEVASDHFYTEQALKKSKLKWTILRNNSFSETLLLTMPHFLQHGNTIFTSSEQAKRSFICRQDCATIAAFVALHPSQYVDRVIDVVGTEAMSMDKVTEVLSKVIKKPLKTVQLDDTDYKKKVSSVAPEWWTNICLDFEKLAREGKLETTNCTFKEIVGRDPIPLEKFFESNRNVFFEEGTPSTFV